MEKQHMDTIKGDGGHVVMTPELMKELKGEVDLISNDLKRRCLMDESPDKSRFAFWDGQDPDGLKHADNLREEVEPFEGSMDTRVRDVDMLINEDTMLCVAAAMRARIDVKGRGASDIANAGKMKTTLEYFLRNGLALKWLREQCRLANFVFGSAPGMGFLSINWRHEEALELKTVTLTELRSMFVEAGLGGWAGGPPAVQGGVAGEPPAVQDEAAVQAQIEALAGAFDEALADPATQADALQQLIGEMFPELKSSRVRKMSKELLKQLRAGVEDPVVEFPMPYVRVDDLDVHALRVGGDMHLPVDTRDFEACTMYLTVENLSRTAVETRARAEEWDDEFTQAVLGTGGANTGMLGKAVLRSYRKGGTNGERALETDGDYVAKRYQILTSVLQLVNDEGIPGIYYVTWHYDLNEPAHELRLMNYKHGKLPGVMYVREYISGCLTDSRGIPEIQGAAQNQRKTLLDGGGNNALLGFTPPVLTKNRRGMGRLWIQPMQEQQLKRDGDLAWMDPPKMTQHFFDMLERLGLDRDDYFGRAHKDIPESRTALHQQFKVLLWLAHTRDALVQMMQLIQQFAPDEVIERVTDQKGLPFMRSRDEIQGLYDVELMFDPGDLDIENLETYGKIVKDIVLAMDANKTIDTTPLVSDLMYRLNPSIAPAAVRTLEEANSAELQDEARALAEIRAGVESDMPDDGSINYQLRLEWYQGMEAENEMVFADMAEDKRVLLMRRMEFLEFQMEQFGENAQTGRTGVSTGTPGEVMAEE